MVPRGKRRVEAWAESMEPRVLLSIFTVTNTADSGPGSLRQAILDANASPNANQVVDSILFSIPGSGVHTIEPLAPLPDITDGVAILGYSQPGSRLGSVLTIEIDGQMTPQPLVLHFTGPAAAQSSLTGICLNHAGGILADTPVHITGNFLGTDPTGLTASGTMGTVIDLEHAAGSYIYDNVIANGSQYGLLMNGGSSTSVLGNLIGVGADGATAIGNRIGVALRGENSDIIGSGNTISGNRAFSAGDPLAGRGIDIQDSRQITVQSNWIGTDSTGTRAVPNQGTGLYVRGTGLGCAINHNTISGNAGDGIDLNLTQSDTIIASNWIGTDSSGTHALSNGGSGVVLMSTFANFQHDVISGNALDGIDCQGGGAVHTLIGLCEIGTDASGQLDLGNGRDGVRVESGAQFVNGGADIVAFNHGNGITVGLSPTDTSLASIGGRIFANHHLGIDLGNDGVTPNTPGGPHSGPNHLDNFPVITAARSGKSQTFITGTLNSTPNTTFVVLFYANAAADPSGYGQGQTQLGGTNVTTDASGNASFSYVLGRGALAGQAMTAVAVEAPGAGMSEFSADVPITLESDLNSNGTVDFDDLLILARHYGANATPEQGDINGSGRVDFSDLLILAQDYGETIPASPVVAAQGSSTAWGITDSIANRQASRRRHGASHSSQ